MIQGWLYFSINWFNSNPGGGLNAGEFSLWSTFWSKSEIILLEQQVSKILVAIDGYIYRTKQNYGRYSISLTSAKFCGIGISLFLWILVMHSKQHLPYDKKPFRQYLQVLLRNLCDITNFFVSRYFNNHGQNSMLFTYF